MNIKKIEEKLKEQKIECSKKEIDLLEKYYEILVRENKKYNLTAIIEKEEVYLKHFYDSLTLTKIIDLKQNLKVCDIGSGAGFPGIILKIFYPNLKITLVDSSEKKTDFLKLITKKLHLKNIEIITSRAEKLNKYEEFDVVTARAVAPLKVLLEISSQIIKVNGYFIALKGKKGESELEDSKRALKKLDLKTIKVEKIKLPEDVGERTIIKIKKEKKTSKKYPRNYSKIKNNPL